MHGYCGAHARFRQPHAHALVCARLRRTPRLCATGALAHHTPHADTLGGPLRDASGATGSEHGGAARRQDVHRGEPRRLLRSPGGRRPRRLRARPASTWSIGRTALAAVVAVPELCSCTLAFCMHTYSLGGSGRLDTPRPLIARPKTWGLELACLRCQCTNAPMHQCTNAVSEPTARLTTQARPPATPTYGSIALTLAPSPRPSSS